MPAVRAQHGLTGVCRMWQQGGKCTFGASCVFLHSAVEKLGPDRIALADVDGTSERAGADWEGAGADWVSDASSTSGSRPSWADQSQDLWLDSDGVRAHDLEDELLHKVFDCSASSRSGADHRWCGSSVCETESSCLSQAGATLGSAAAMERRCSADFAPAGLGHRRAAAAPEPASGGPPEELPRFNDRLPIPEYLPGAVPQPLAVVITTKTARRRRQRELADRRLMMRSFNTAAAGLTLEAAQSLSPADGRLQCLSFPRSFDSAPQRPPAPPTTPRKMCRIKEGDRSLSTSRRCRTSWLPTTLGQARTR
ncbi:unnamed protein product [Prorocentrum cordatum]|uniref:C3H1-type domain-containing protein n=1 Tax=Prorocentrum cordatum TaxID=2364126 RepID=A0ABN9XU34_9DINO|nr:unnamed protein product [Polarella glacialis]